jgi:hypothetical protein
VGAVRDLTLFQLLLLLLQLLPQLDAVLRALSMLPGLREPLGKADDAMDSKAVLPLSLLALLLLVCMSQLGRSLGLPWWLLLLLLLTTRVRPAPVFAAAAAAAAAALLLLRMGLAVLPADETLLAAVLAAVAAWSLWEDGEPGEGLDPSVEALSAPLDPMSSREEIRLLLLWRLSHCLLLLRRDTLGRALLLLLLPVEASSAAVGRVDVRLLLTSCERVGKHVAVVVESVLAWHLSCTWGWSKEGGMGWERQKKEGTGLGGRKDGQRMEGFMQSSKARMKPKSECILCCSFTPALVQGPVRLLPCKLTLQLAAAACKLHSAVLRGRVIPKQECFRLLETLLRVKLRLLLLLLSQARPILEPDQGPTMCLGELSTDDVGTECLLRSRMLHLRAQLVSGGSPGTYVPARERQLPMIARLLNYCT